MIPIIRWTLWQRRWYIFWWSIALILYMALVVGVYPSFKGQTSSLNSILNNWPAAAKSLLTDSSNIFSPAGYLSSKAYYIVLPLMFCALSVGLGSSLIATDEQNHTIENLLVRPISRARLLFSRTIVGVLLVSIVALATAGATVAVAAAVKFGIPLKSLFVVSLMSALIGLLFGALSFVFSSFGKRARKFSMGVALILFVASYLFTSLNGTVHWLRWPAKLLPFNYYHPTDMMAGEYHWPAAVIAVMLVVIFGLVSYLGFRKRDIA